MDNQLTLPKLAKAAGLVSMTARRYVDRFPEIFHQVQEIDGVKRYPDFYIEVLQRMYALYQNKGLTRSDILNTIKDEYPELVADEAASVPVFKPMVNKQDLMIEALVRIEKLLERISDVLEKAPAPIQAQEGSAKTEPEIPTAKPVKVKKAKTNTLTSEEQHKIGERIMAMRQEGKSYKQIAETLNAEKVPTFSGKGEWHKGSVGRVVKKFENKDRL